MDSDELKLSAMALIIKIYAITGWNVPESETLDILIDQMILKIEENYPRLNSNEVEYAFRNSIVQDYGKNFNLFSFEQVIEGYLKERAEASRLEEQIKIPEEMPIEISKDEKVKDIEDFINRTDINWKDDKIYYLIPAFIYDNMVEFGYINHTEKDKIRLYRKASIARLNELRELATKNNHEIKHYKYIENIYMKGEVMPVEEVNIIHNIYKKFSIMDYVVNLKK